MEKFIWTELLSFDNTSENFGVEAYLDTIGYIPDGISLMLSHPDFVFLHSDMEREYNLFDDVSSRHAHDSNEERQRQQWTSFELRGLIGELHRHNIKVFCSVFGYHTFDKYHKEWASGDDNAICVHKAIGVTPLVQLISRLRDGRYTEDIFVERLEKVMLDYDFDGYHGPDCMGPGGAMSVCDYSDNIIAQFCEYLGRTPKELAEPLYDVRFEYKYDTVKLTARSEYIWNNLRKEWHNFYTYAWTRCWTKIIAMLKKHGKLSMINSGNTKADFEAKYIYGLDYRNIEKLGLDYILVECVAANCSLVFGGQENHFNFLTTLADTKAMLPTTKILFLHGVKDVVESYDLLRHAPAKLEREVFSLTNFYYTEKADEVSRCADGFMVCLGDGIKKQEWAFLRETWRLGEDFTPNKAGEFIWVWCDDTMDKLEDEFPQYGTFPGYKQVAELLSRYDIQISTVARAESVPRLKGNLFVPNAHLWSKEHFELLRDYKGGKVIVTGNFPDDFIGKKVCQRVGDYNLTLAVLNEENSCKRLPDIQNGFSDEQSPECFWYPVSYMTVSDEFFEQCFEIMCKYKTAPICINETLVNIYGKTVPQKEVRIITLENGTNIRLCLINTAGYYNECKLNFRKIPKSVEKKSGFPYTSVTVNEKGEFKCGSMQTPLHIPPFGIIVMDCDK